MIIRIWLAFLGLLLLPLATPKEAAGKEVPAKVETALREIRVIGRSLKLEFDLIERTLAPGEDPVAAIAALAEEQGVTVFILDLPREQVEQAARALAERPLLLFNVRHRDDAPYGIMDFLFIRLMLWGKERGDKWFDLGMAPLSGLDTHPLAPVWTRVGALVFRHGEHFYNFEGLRAYKEKFDPVWTPKYLAAPGGLALPRILLDIAALISGGAKEIVLK